MVSFAVRCTTLTSNCVLEYGTKIDLQVPGLFISLARVPCYVKQTIHERTYLMHECIRTERSNKSSTGLLDREPELSSLWADFLSESERDLEETQKDLENAKSKLEDTRKDLQDRKNELRVQTELLQGLRTLDGSRSFIPSEHERVIFPALPQEEPAEGTEGRPLRICIVSPEFVGPFRCGGIGTFYTELGKVLAGAGHHVTFLFSRRDYCEIRTVEYWIEHYRDQGIRFEPIRACPLKVSIPEHQAIPYDVYYWLKDRNFDIIHFPELSGVGYYSLLAKKQGLGFSRTTLMCVGTHGPCVWCRFANQEYPSIMWDRMIYGRPAFQELLGMEFNPEMLFGSSWGLS